MKLSLILFAVLGIVILGSLFLTFVILSIRLKQRRKQKYSIRTCDDSNLNDANNQVDENHLDNESFANHETNLENDLNRKCFEPFKTEYKRINRLPSDYKSNVIFLNK